MDASQYKDYVLFIKYITDKYGNSADSPCLPSAPENPWVELVGAHEHGCAACESAVEQTTWGVKKSMYR